MEQWWNGIGRGSLKYMEKKYIQIGYFRWLNEYGGMVDGSDRG
jgi:hypothetical protein